MQKTESLCVYIPFFNEENKSINIFLENLKILNKYDFINEIYLVDDGSDDNTLSILNNFSKNQKSNKFKLFNNNKNKGVGFSFKEVLKV